MKKSTTDKNEPIGKLVRVKDFLPSPSELVKSDPKVKVTIELDESTIIFFKEQAGKNKTKYQKMMREVLSYYAKKFAA